MCDSVNHTRFPKEDHLPNWERRDNKVTKGDRAECVQQKWAGIVCTECVRMDVFRSQFRRFTLPRCSVRPSLLRGVTRRGLVVVTGLTFRDSLSLPSASVRKPKNNSGTDAKHARRAKASDPSCCKRTDGQTDTWLRTWRNFVSFEWVPSILRKYPMT